MQLAFSLSPTSFYVCVQVGIFYDKAAQAEAAALVSAWTLADMQYMREQVWICQHLMLHPFVEPNFGSSAWFRQNAS